MPATSTCVCARCRNNHCSPFHAGNVLAGKQYSALSMDWGEPRRERKADKQWGNLTCKDKLIKLCLFGLAKRRRREDIRVWSRGSEHAVMKQRTWYQPVVCSYSFMILEWLSSRCSKRVKGRYEDSFLSHTQSN